MTVISDSKLYRKAFLGFLLCAHQRAEGDTRWETARDRTNILTKAGNLGSLTGRAGRFNPRPVRSSKQVLYQEPSSSDIGSSQGSDMQIDAMRRAAQKGEKTSYSHDQCFPPWEVSRPRELERSEDALGVLGCKHIRA